MAANKITCYDTDSINQGKQYRNDGVDIENCSDIGGGYDVAWIAPGEWLTYTVNVLYSGTYTLQARVAAYVSGDSFHVELNGVNISGYKNP